jgi:hypothetical protein
MLICAPKILFPCNSVKNLARKFAVSTRRIDSLFGFCLELFVILNSGSGAIHIHADLVHLEDIDRVRTVHHR